MRNHFLRAAVGNSVDETDEFISNTEFILGHYGTTSDNGANLTIKDSSTSNHSITRNGDVTQGSFSPFSPKGWSGYFDGSGDYLTFGGTDFQFGTGDYTIEFWVYVNSVPSSVQFVYGGRHTSPYNSGAIDINFTASGTLQYAEFITASTSVNYVETNPINAHEWTHYALCRSAGTTRLYRNGVQLNSQSSSTNISSTHPTVKIGADYNFGRTFNGYLSNFRVIKGTALYTADFTPPTEPLTAVTNTKLLTLQDNRFIDNSASNHSITVNGGTAIKPTSPFSGNREYPKASYFSGKFDGSNDYLEVDPGSGTYFSFPSGGFNSTSLTGFSHGAGSQSSYQGQGPVSGYYRFTNATSYSGGYIVDNTARQYNKDFSIKFKMAPQGNHFPDGFCMSLNDNASTIGTRGVMVPPANGGRQVFFYVINWFGPQPPYQTLQMYEETTGTANQIGYAASTTGSNVGTSTSGFFGGTQYWWWDYEHSTGTHKIYHSTSSTKPSTPRVTATFTMPSTPLHAYIGGGTGGANTEWRLLEWSAEAPSPNADDFAFGSGDFTYDAWIYPTSFSGGSKRIFYPSANADSLTMGGNSTSYGAGTLSYWTGSSQLTSTTGAISANQWTHVAVTRNGSTVRIFVNGSLNASGTVSAANNTSSGTTMRVGGNPSDSTYFNGYISNARVVKGTALYTAAFTPSTAPLTPVANTKLLTLQDNYLVDHSLSGHSITNNGGVTLEPESPFSNSTYPLSGTFYSGYFDGTNDNLTIPDNSAFDLSSGDFTVEGWIKPLSNIDTMYFGQWLGWGWFFGVSQGTLQFASYSGGTYYLENSGVAPSTYYNKWTHIAATREGNTLRIFVNGEKKGGDHTLSHTFTNSSGNFEIGSNGGSQYYNGYISNVRIVKGTALYTSDFTVPSEPLTAVSGTTLLTLQDATIQDNSASSHSITNNGATVTEIAPFGAALIDRAGSMHFDGNGDYLRCDAALDSFTAADDPFTIEAWFYCNSVDSSAIETIFGVNWFQGTDNTLLVSVRGVSGTPNIWLHYKLSGGTQIDAAQGAFSLHTWNHIAASYDGTTFRLYLNGNQIYSNTGTPHESFDGCAFCVGAELDMYDVAGNYFDGYITDVRIVKSALYTSNFTPPTAPLQPITNTQLLLNGTNASVEDALGKHMVRGLNNVNHYIDNANVSIQGDYAGADWGPIIETYPRSNTLTTRTLVPSTTNWAEADEDWTLEFYYFPSHSSDQNVFAFGDSLPVSSSSGTSLRLHHTVTNNVLTLYRQSQYGSTTVLSKSASGISQSTWCHIAVVKSGSTIYLYKDGAYKASGSYSSEVGSGQFALPGSYDGFDEMRFTKGVARYSGTATSDWSNFPKQTAKYPLI